MPLTCIVLYHKYWAGSTADMPMGLTDKYIHLIDQYMLIYYFAIAIV